MCTKCRFLLNTIDFTMVDTWTTRDKGINYIHWFMKNRHFCWTVINYVQLRNQRLCGDLIMWIAHVYIRRFMRNQHFCWTIINVDYLVGSTKKPSFMWWYDNVDGTYHDQLTYKSVAWNRLKWLSIYTSVLLKKWR